MKRPPINQQITFLHTQDLDETRRFYTDVLGLRLVRDQGTCIIFKITQSAYLGFCEHIESIAPGRKVILTLVSDDVDEWYTALIESGQNIINPPTTNPKYEIYHFFLTDPNGYWIEIQRFDQPL